MHFKTFLAHSTHPDGVFDGHWRHVLSSRGDDHLLASSGQVVESSVVHHAQVPRVKPAVIVHTLASLLIVV